MIVDIFFLLFGSLLSLINGFLSLVISVFNLQPIVDSFNSSLISLLSGVWYWQGMFDVPASLNFLGRIAGVLAVYFMFNAIMFVLSKIRGVEHN